MKNKIVSTIKETFFRVNKRCFWIIYFVLGFSFLQAQQKSYLQHTIAFYNTENLFDTIHNPHKFDEEFTPDSERRWNTKKYHDKIGRIAQVISTIGIDDHQKNLPTLIGLCEVENRSVLQDLISHTRLKSAEYQIEHFESPDSRGIDVALIYQKEFFSVLNASKHPLKLFSKEGKSMHTRDQLLVTGLLEDELVHILVNHWPSRYGGVKKSEPARIAAAQLNRRLVDSLLVLNPLAKIITMGDFNDSPQNESIKDILKTTPNPKLAKNGILYNPMYALAKKGLGTLAYDDSWELFDQIIISESFITKQYTQWQFRNIRIANMPFLIQSTGKYKGYPLRSTNQSAGYSDHFPVYITLIREYLD